jgi:hypothetical protein
LYAQMSILCGLLPAASPIAYLLIACAGLVIANMLTGRVVGIAGGDTLTVLDARFEQHKIWLVVIGAPERAPDSKA